MRTVRTVVIAFMAFYVAVLAVPTPAAAQCDAEFDALRSAITNATFLGQNAVKEQAGLLRRLDEAEEKLAQGKTSDALLKLTQLRNKVEDLNAQGKIDPEDADLVLQAADAAIACVQASAGG